MPPLVSRRNDDLGRDSKFPADDPDLGSAIDWSRCEGNLLQSINKTLQGRHEPAMHWKNHPVTVFSDLIFY